MDQNTAHFDSSTAVPAVVGSGSLREEERRRAFQNAIAEVARYRSLPAGWDHEGGLPACPKAADFAQRLIETLLERREIGPPFVCPISTGVFLQWESGDATLYFEADEESVVSMTRKGDTVLESGEDPHFGVERARDLVAKFHRVHAAPAGGSAQRAV